MSATLINEEAIASQIPYEPVHQMHYYFGESPQGSLIGLKYDPWAFSVIGAVSSRRLAKFRRHNTADRSTYTKAARAAAAFI